MWHHGNAIFIITALIITLAGCQSTLTTRSDAQLNQQPVISVNYHQVAQVPVIQTEAIFSLTEQQQAAFLDYFNHPSRAHIDKHSRLAQYIETILPNFNFRGATLTATQALEQQSGNCLSLAVLTHALADLVNVKVTYKKVHTPPVYSKDDRVIRVAGHVISVLHNVKRDQFGKKVTSTLVIDYFPSASFVKGNVVNYQDFVSMFYQNLAADALDNQNYGLALSLLNHALTLSPYNTETLNTLAVVYSHMGDTQGAIDIAEYLVKYKANNLLTINNYTTWLIRESRIQDAEHILVRWQSINEDNPFYWLELAEQHVVAGELVKAENMFTKVIEMAPYIHNAYFGMAKVAAMRNKTGLTSHYLDTALKYAYLPEDQRLYHAKLSNMAR